MRHFSYVFSLVLAVFVFSCGPALPGEATVPTGGDQNQGPAQIAADPPPASNLPPVKKYDGPAHVFTAASHPPHHPYVEPPKPNLRALPGMKMRFNKCFGIPVEKNAQIAGGSGSRRGASIGSGGQTRKTGKGKKGGAYSRSKAKPKSPAAKSSAQPSMPSSAPAPAPAAAFAPDAVATETAGADSFSTMDGAMKGEAMPAAEPMADRESEDEAKVASDYDAAQVADETTPNYEDWGAAIYLSNDDTMSLSSAQRVIYAIDNFLPLPLQHIRPHELLNYFSFDTAPVGGTDDFSVLGNIQSDPREEGIYNLSLAVDSRPLDKQTRRNAVVTFVIDRSGSMSSEGRMSYLKRGLKKMIGELKEGDMVNLVIFDDEVCVPMQNFVVGRDKMKKLERVISALKPRGGTDLHLGLSRGYKLADKSYQEKYTNRVVMISDALTNTGVTDTRMISMISKYFDQRRIRLSGVGVGKNFNDALLDKLTERGKGAYVFLGSEAEVDAVFGPRFISLIETTALNVHFRLHLPPSLRMNVFYGEESSTVKEDVQEIHYFANTSQLFLSDLMARGGELRPQDHIMVTIDYEDPETGQKMEEQTAFILRDIQGESKNVKKARLVMAWIDMLAQMASRPLVGANRYSRGGWEDEDGFNRCEDGRVELARLSNGVSSDPEVKRVLELWDKYCARYDRPRNPVRRKISDGDSWPGAQSTENNR